VPGDWAGTGCGTLLLESRCRPFSSVVYFRNWPSRPELYTQLSW